jgi:hypothetical protein
MATVLGSQILVPRILQHDLSAGAYVSYVAVTSLAAYLGLVDGGMLLAIARELSVLHGVGDRARFGGEARRARRVFTAIALAGWTVAAVGLSSALAASESAWSGAASASFRASVVAVLVAAGLSMGAGSYHSVALLATGRLLAAQVFTVAALLLPMLVLVAALLRYRDLTLAFFGSAAVTATIAAWRASDAHRCVRAETRGVAPADPPTPLLRLVTAGAALKAADVLPASAYPQLLSVRAPELVPTGVPARTYANGCRMLPQQLLNLLQVHVTRRMAGGDAERGRGEREYAAAASSLAAFHLLALSAAAAFAVPVFRLWLPASADQVVRYLPGLFAEQALLGASLPCSILFTATGGLRTLGLVRLGGAALGLAVFLTALGSWPEAAYGIGFAASALPLYALGGWAELRPARGFPRPRGPTLARYLAGAVAAAACGAYALRPALVAAVLALCGAALLPASLRAFWRTLRELKRGTPVEGAALERLPE